MAGWGGATFLAAYQRNIGRQTEEAVASSVVAQVVVAFMENRELWQGPASTLKPALDEVAVSQGVEPKDRRSGWPQDAARLSKELRRLAETLAALGVEVTFPTQGKKRSILFRTLAESTVGTVSTVSSNGETADGDTGRPDGTPGQTEGGPAQSSMWADGADGADGKNGSLSGPWSEEL